MDTCDLMYALNLLSFILHALKISVEVSLFIQNKSRPKSWLHRYAAFAANQSPAMLATSLISHIQ
jgi:hypothetical protein